MRADERDLVLEEETRPRTGPADEATIAGAADDDADRRCHGPGTMNAARSTAVAAPRLPLSPRVRRSVLTVHIAASVGLLGDVAAVLAVNVRAASTDDPELARSAYELLDMFGLVFGIPLSVTALATGLALGLGTKWGVLRHRWVTAKLLLVVSVVLVGALAIGPATAAMRAGEGGREGVLIVAATYDVVALALATGLSVFKPGGRRPRPTRTA